MHVDQRYRFALDDTGLERLRSRFSKERGQVTAFLVQYETTIGEERFPVVRYDGIHGFAHRDILNRPDEVDR